MAFTVSLRDGECRDQSYAYKIYQILYKVYLLIHFLLQFVLQSGYQWVFVIQLNLVPIFVWRNHPNFLPIQFINLMLGFTFYLFWLGWLLSIETSRYWISSSHMEKVFWIESNIKVCLYRGKVFICLECPSVVIHIVSFFVLQSYL